MTEYKPYAPFLDRAIAYLIDSIALAALIPLLGKVIPVLSDSHIYLILSVNYFMFCHQKWGQTLGKMAVGIQVVTLDDQLPLSAPRTLLRELARLLIPLTFFIGYLIPIFHIRNQALHDFLGKTCVVSLRPSGTSLAKTALTGAVSMLGLMGVGVYVLLFTSVPLQSAVERLQKSGIQISGVEGSLFNGFTIARYSHSTPLASVQMSNLTFTYKLSELILNDRIVIEQVSVDSGTIEVMQKAAIQSVTKNALNSENQKTPSVGKSDDETLRHNSSPDPVSLLIRTVDINQLKLISEKKELSVNRVYLSQLISDTLEKKISFERVYMDADGLMIDVGNTTLSRDAIFLDRPTHFTLKKGFFQNQARDIKGQVSMIFDGSKFQSLSFSVFDNRVRGQIKKSMARFSILQFQPNQYFSTYQPVTELSLNAQGPPASFLMGGSWVGTMHLGSQKVSVVKNKFRTTLQDNRVAEGEVSVFQIFKSVAGGETSALQWMEKPDLASMAQWYYQKGYDDLAAEQQLSLKGIHKGFGNPVPRKEDINNEIRRPASREMSR